MKKNLIDKLKKGLFIILVLILLLLTAYFLYLLVSFLLQGSLTDNIITIARPILGIAIIAATLQYLQKGSEKNAKSDSSKYDEYLEDEKTINPETQEVSKTNKSKASTESFYKKFFDSTKHSRDKTDIDSNENTGVKVNKRNPIWLVIIIILVIVLIIPILGNPFGEDPIVGIWINSEIAGPYDSDYTVTDYVYLDIDDDQNFLTINYVTTTGSDNVYGSGHWSKEGDVYIIHIRYVWTDEEDIYVYIIEDELFLDQTNQSWGYYKQN